MPLDRITQQPEVMGGKPCIRGLRVTVGMVVGQIGAGRSVDDVLADYPYLEREDIMQALRHAAWRAQQPEVDAEPRNGARARIDARRTRLRVLPLQGQD